MMSTGWRRSYAVLLGGTVVTVAAADFLFYGHAVGWTAAAFGLVVLAVLAVRDAAFAGTTGGRVLLVGAAGLLVALVEQPTWLNVAYAILCVGGLAIVNAFGWPRDVPEWARRWGRLLGTGWMRLLSDNGVVIRCLARHGISPATARGALAWVVPTLLAGVFVGMFAWGNPVLAGWLWAGLTWAGESLAALPDVFSLPRVLFWLAFATFAWTLLRARGKRLRGTAPGGPPQPAPVGPFVATQEPARERAIAASVVRCLILFNLVFLVENALDVRYLGDRSLLPPGMEYREYVRRGAYPLVGAALMAGVFVLVTFRPGSETERSPWARRLVYLWIGQTIFLTLTASWRLGQYVGFSELTRLRVASTIWFALVAAGLLFIVWRIMRGRSNRWLINANALTALLVLYPCCFVNFDGIIAEFNVRHCREGGGPGSPLDIEYFRALGTTSLASLERIRPKLGLEKGTRWRAEQARRVSEHLYGELSEHRSDWRAWTWRRARAAEAVEAVELQLAAGATSPVASATSGTRR